MIRTALLRAAASALALTLITAGQAGAWSSTGHRIIGELGVASLPADLPAFLKRPEVIQQMGELSREPDRSRGAGQPHDEDLDPGHFIDLTDDGHVLGGPLITDMPKNRDAYSAVLHAAGSDLHKSGWLYYNLIDGYQQLSKDFAYWRVDVVGEKRSTDPKQKAWYVADRKLRELIIIRDLGYWSHFVGDASQPMHASVHYNGWGEYPNPNNYTQDHIHGPFEGAFVHDNLTEAMVRAALPAPAPCSAAIGKCMADYLLASQAKVEPLYALWTTGAFTSKDPKAVAFATERVAEGAAKLRDLVVRAWQEAGAQTVGYPGIKVSAIEGGAELPFGVMYGDD
jgi:hypothetical protein